MKKKAQHVIYWGGRWSVRVAGGKRASKIFKTQREAIENARKKAQGSELYIHGSDGRIKERYSFKPMS